MELTQEQKGHKNRKDTRKTCSHFTDSALSMMLQFHTEGLEVHTKHVTSATLRDTIDKDNTINLSDKVVNVSEPSVF